MIVRNTIKTVVLIFISVMMSGPMADAQVDADSVLAVLDREIEMRDDRFARKENEFAVLKESMRKASDLRSRYDACARIFDRYMSYQFDSAYVYANRMLEMAHELRDSEAIAKAQVKLVYCYLSVGYYKEAEETADEIVLDGVSPETLVDYYTNMAHLHQNLSYYAESTLPLARRYRELFERDNRLLLESAAMLSDSIEREKLFAQRNLLGLPAAEAMKRRLKLLGEFDLTENDKAVQYYILSEEAEKIGDRRMAIAYLALSALCDLRGNVRETLATTTLAGLMKEEGNIDAAKRYIEIALEDARFYNSHIREMQANSLLSEIENLRFVHSERQRYLSLSVMAVVLMSLIFIVGLYWGLRRKNRLLNRMRRESEEKSVAIDRTNEELKELNRQLNEVNLIKERYIVQSLCSDQSFINGVEERCRAIDRKLKTKQYDDLPAILRHMGIKQERRRIAEAFDSAFLSLFPNFIDEFNKLFPPEYHIGLTADGQLPTEVRIYGLMRLGIEDTAAVSSYLNVSVNTIYVYKARVKARTIVPKEEFERHIMAITKP